MSKYKLAKKGDTLITNNGYVLVFTSEKWMLQHRYIMEIYLGRKLRPKEIVHHIDSDKKNNLISNLQLIDQSTHAKHHVQTTQGGKINPVYIELPEYEICELYQLGKTVEELAELYSVSIWVIVNRLRKNKINIRNRGWKVGDKRNKGGKNV